MNLTTVARAPISAVAAALRTGLVAAVTLAVLLVAPQAAEAELSAWFTFSPETPSTYEQVVFTAASTEPGETQRWDLSGNRVCDDASGPSAQRSFLGAGVYSVTLCVSNGTDEATTTRKVTVMNRPPVAAFTYAPSAPLAGDTVSLTSISADPDGPITSQAWDLDNDGVFDDAYGATALLSLPLAGSFPVRLQVTDRDGADSVALTTITVGERPPDAITPFPVVSMVSVVSAEGTRLEQLVISAPEGARIRIRCRGHGCPFQRLTRMATVTRPATRVQALVSKRVRIRAFARHTLRPGAVVQIWVTKRGEIGKYTRFRIRKGKPPNRADRCLPPGARRPMRCPGS
jgi:hypothetical protein